MTSKIGHPVTLIAKLKGQVFDSQVIFMSVCADSILGNLLTLTAKLKCQGTVRIQASYKNTEILSLLLTSSSVTLPITL